MNGLAVAGPHSIQDLSRVPRLPGLYVWYARFHVQEADWSAAFAGGDDAAGRHLLKAIREQSLKYERQEMAIRAASNFSSVWNGTLREDPGAKWHTNGGDAGESDAFDDRLKAGLTTDPTRHHLIALLDVGFPLFHSPLYIGKASDQTLMDRLGRHASRYLKLWDRYQRDRQFLDRLTTPKNFAERAIKLGFCPDDLFCMTLAVDVGDTEGLDTDAATALIEAAEWLLNRWATPTLGRQ
jgi:hypothetical protein